MPSWTQEEHAEDVVWAESPQVPPSGDERSTTRAGNGTPQAQLARSLPHRDGTFSSSEFMSKAFLSCGKALSKAAKNASGKVKGNLSAASRRAQTHNRLLESLDNASLNDWYVR